MDLLSEVGQQRSDPCFDGLEPNIPVIRFAALMIGTVFHRARTGIERNVMVGIGRIP